MDASEMEDHLLAHGLSERPSGQSEELNKQYDLEM